MFPLSRHLFAILLLPFVVVIVVPFWLLNALYASDSRWSTSSFVETTARIAGILILIVGLMLFSWCVVLFARVGKGTLAPWDPTQKLVALGPYQYVRNPMISGVVMMLVGQAFFWGSWAVGAWACLFLGMNHVYFIFSEEPALEARFGENYRRYKANVPRWLPRMVPGRGD